MVRAATGAVGSAGPRGGPATVEVVRAADHSRTAGARAIQPLLERPPDRRPTAVFGVTDVLALSVLDEAARRHIAVPAELSVAGFDDIPAAAHSAPPLTTVSQGLFEQGRVAARMVLDRIAGQPRPAPALTTTLVVRGSTGPTP
jgi:DNA-binding LacI/PurR family transcriptional regulator